MEAIKIPIRPILSFIYSLGTSLNLLAHLRKVSDVSKFRFLISGIPGFQNLDILVIFDPGILGFVNSKILGG